jgi:regulation of enolase protein 1 (concanavalin A-like superfamily)
VDYYANNTGATVGHFQPPFAEQDIVHSGRQSMYAHYDNDGTVNEGTDYEQDGTLFYSEAQRQWEAPQDWTRRGVNSLTMWLRGIPASVGSFTAGPPITMTAVGADIWGESDQFHYAYKRLSGLGSITAKVVSMTNTHNAAKAGVMIRESLQPDAAHTMVAIQPINGVQLVYRPTAGDESTSVEQSDISPAIWVRLTRSGNSITGDYSVDGNTWQILETATVPMLSDVYVGLIVCSHNANATCTAEFSDVATTGTVTGDWQSQDIGIESNTAEPMYVVLTDNAGSSALVNHPDPNATTISTWTEWNIPLTDFTGVNLQAIKSVTIGVGNSANTQPGGAGDLYIDDIWLNLP